LPGLTSLNMDLLHIQEKEKEVKTNFNISLSSHML
jgi:hypothetical protein